MKRISLLIDEGVTSKSGWHEIHMALPKGSTPCVDHINEYRKFQMGQLAANGYVLRRTARAARKRVSARACS